MLFDSPLLSTQLTSILSPLAPPFRRKVNTGLRDTAWLISASSTGLPFCFTTTFRMWCRPSFICAVVIGWVISTRTSVWTAAVFPPASVARIFIGPAAISASAPADGDLDLARGAVVLAARNGEHAHVRGLAHLHVELDEGQRALLEVEPAGEREGVLLDQHRDRRGSGDIRGDLDRHHRAVLGDLRRLDHDVLARRGCAGAEALQRVGRALGAEGLLVPGGEHAERLGEQQAEKREQRSSCHGSYFSCACDGIPPTFLRVFPRGAAR